MRFDKRSQFFFESAGNTGAVENVFLVQFETTPFNFPAWKIIFINMNEKVHNRKLL